MRGILLAMALSAAAAAQVPDTEQALSFKTASGPQISPDGRSSRAAPFHFSHERCW